MKYLLLLFPLLIFGPTNAQISSITDAFTHHVVITATDTVHYHTFSNGHPDSATNLLIYLQGSSAQPLFEVVEQEGMTNISTSIPFDFNQIPENFLFVLISKKGFPFVHKGNEPYPVPQTYYEHQTLDYRTHQADLVVNDLMKLNKNPFDKIVALGHSEGSDVVAKLGTINKEVTHFGYWSGGGNTQFIDFITFIRQRVNEGNMTEEEAAIEIESIFKKLREIMANPDATDKFWSGQTNSYRRWSHFSEPPVENLLKIDRPIFAAIGTNDQSVAIESAYLIPIEFIRHRKENLTFKAYPNLDHSFGQYSENGSYISYSDKVFVEFLEWLEEH